MRHKKTSFFLSGIYLSIELLLFIICISAKNYILTSVLFAIFCLEEFRTYRKTKLLTKGYYLTPEKKALRNSYYGARSNYYHYFNIWYRFADASEQKYIAAKFQQFAKKIRSK